jgi:hypothetical protein
MRIVFTSATSYTYKDMKTHNKIKLTLAMLCASFIVPSFAAQITFTGGVVTLSGGSTGTTNSFSLYGDVDYYEEDGFKLDFIGGNQYIGDYYGAGNDVIHGHWMGMTQIYVSKLDGTSFDLNYFVLTSNTFNGGGAATGGERVFIHASQDGTTSSYSELLPPEDWGFPATQIYLGPEFDNVKAFWFTAENSVFCFGMDSFYIDEAAPPQEGAVPEPGTNALLGLGLLTFAGYRCYGLKR